MTFSTHTAPCPFKVTQPVILVIFWPSYPAAGRDQKNMKRPTKKLKSVRPSFLLFVGVLCVWEKKSKSGKTSIFDQPLTLYNSITSLLNLSRWSYIDLQSYSFSPRKYTSGRKSEKWLCMAIVVFCSWLEKNENCYFIVNWNHDQFNELKSAPLFSAFFEAFSESDPFIPASSVKRHGKSIDCNRPVSLVYTRESRQKLKM